MDLDTFRTNIRLRLGIPSGDAMFSDTDLMNLTNTSIRHLSAEADWDWLIGSESINTVDATETITPGATWVRTIDLTIGVYAPLRKITVDELDYMDGASGQPKFYAVMGGGIVLRPIPNAVYAIQHRFVKSETALTSGANTPLVPTVFHDAIVEYASYLAFRRINQMTDAKAALEGYQMWLAKMHGRGDRYADTTGGGENGGPPQAVDPK